MQISKLLWHQISIISDAVSIAIVGENIFVLQGDFIPSSSGNTSSIDFVSMVVVNVTEFFTQNPVDQSVNTVQFTQKFLRYIEPLPALRMKFNKSMEYMVLSS